MVGDGLSIAARDATRLATVGKDGQLQMDSLRYAGWTHTDSLDPEEAVTDSAAGATAFATGVRSYNGAVSVDVNGNSVKTLLEHAKDLRKATGLVTTAQVTDATPAAFGSHVPDRGAQSEIARQFIEVTKPDVILGGGEDWWYPVGDPGAYPDDPADPRPEVSKSTIGNLVELAEGQGYDYVSTPDELAATRSDKVLGLFANEEMFEQFPEGQGDEYAPVVPLTTMTAKALDVLSRDRQGFFLLVEEEAIDEFAHANNAERTIQAGQALDATVALVREYVAKHPDTLVVIVGDHETGGLAIENVSGRRRVRRSRQHRPRRRAEPRGRAVPDREQRPGVHGRLDDRRAHRCGDAADGRGPAGRAAGAGAGQHRRVHGGPGRDARRR